MHQAILSTNDRARRNETKRQFFSTDYEAIKVYRNSKQKTYLITRQQLLRKRVKKMRAYKALLNPWFEHKFVFRLKIWRTFDFSAKHAKLISGDV